MSLITFELQRITRRRGSFYGAMGVALVVALLVAVLAGGDQTEHVWGQAFGIPVVFGATIIGALVGSYDTSQGTMRYLVLTGQPRWKLVLLRLPALCAAIALFAAPAAIIATAAMAGDGQSAEVIGRVLLGTTLGSMAWGAVSMAVGTMLRSNGAGIGVALVLFLAGSILTEVVRSEVSQDAGDYLLPNVVSVVGQLGHATPESPSITIALGTAGLVLIAWLTAILGFAVARATRDEY